MLEQQDVMVEGIASSQGMQMFNAFVLGCATSPASVLLEQLLHFKAGPTHDQNWSLWNGTLLQRFLDGKIHPILLPWQPQAIVSDCCNAGIRSIGLLFFYCFLASLMSVYTETNTRPAGKRAQGNKSSQTPIPGRSTGLKGNR